MTYNALRFKSLYTVTNRFNTVSNRIEIDFPPKGLNRDKDALYKLANRESFRLCHIEALLCI